jgi:O-antigen/teichoic acid export membrane protein
MSGVLGFLDFGFGAATLQFVAEDMARGDKESAGRVIASSLVFYAGVGVFGATALWLAAPWLVQVFSADQAVGAEAVDVFRIGALQFAVFFVLTVYLSVFKGLQRFAFPMLALSALSVLSYGGAVVAVRFGHSGVRGVAMTSLAANLLVLWAAAFAAGVLCRRYGIRLSLGGSLWKTLQRMFGFGAFVGVEKIAGMLVSQAQRLVIAALFGPAAVTVYLTAYTLSVKGIAALRAAFEVLMPRTAELMHGVEEGKLAKLRSLYLKSLLVAGLTSVGGMALLFAVAPSLVHWWLRSPIDAEVSTLVRILCVGLAVNGLTPVAYYMLAGLRRPGINTAAVIADPILMYGILGLLALNGLTLRDFALAQSIDLFLYALGYLGFCEFVVWRRWIPRMLGLTPPPVAGNSMSPGSRMPAVSAAPGGKVP